MTLTGFGIQNMDDVYSYTLRTSREKDELTIKLKEKRFGFLNKTKKASFKRLEKAITVNNEIIMHQEVSPILLRLLNDLDGSKVKRKLVMS